VDRHISRIDEGAGSKKRRRQVSTKGEKPGVCMERTLIVIGGKVLHCVVPKGGTDSVVISSREWISEKLDNGALTKSQRADNGKDSEDGDIEVEPVNAGLLGRSAAVSSRRRVQLAWDGSTTWESESRVVVLGNQNKQRLARWPQNGQKRPALLDPNYRQG
jgi:hypothetical protein